MDPVCVTRHRTDSLAIVKARLMAGVDTCVVVV